MKKILHISDLHISDLPRHGMDVRKLRQLLEALLLDLNNFPGIDTIFVTGDISFSAQQSEYETFLSTFLDPLIDALNLNYSRVIITPGNHDSLRKAWKTTETMYRAQLADKGDEQLIEKVLNELIADNSCARLDNYNLFRDKLDTKHNKKILTQNPIFSVYEIDGVGIAAANSAWLAYEQDKNKLAIGAWQIKEIINSIKKFDSKIIIFHHPLDWLIPFDKKEVTDLLHQSKIKAIFYGHMHEFSMHKEAFFSEDSVLKLQAGRFDISKDDGYGGYSILNLHEKNVFDSGEVIFRKYDYKKNNFRAWTDRAENGIITYSLDNTAPFDAQAFIQCCEIKIDQFEYDLICNTGLAEAQRKKLSEVFIFPSLTIDDEAIAKESIAAAVSANQKKTAQIELNELKISKDSFFILGAENSGKTTIARRIVLDYLREQASRNFENFVFYLDFRGITVNSHHQIRNQLLSFYTDTCESQSFQQKLEKKLDSSNAVFIFDSIEKLNIQGHKALTKFILNNKKAKYIIFGENSCKTTTSTLGAEIHSASDNQLSFRTINIKGIQRAHVRELFQKWTPDNKEKLGRSLRQALKVVENAGMPNNAFVFTMLLSIGERKFGSHKTYMHEADLVENFIEILLQKHVTTTEDSPQYKDILLLLGMIAESMHQADNYSLNENSLRKIILDFNNLISQNFQTDLYLYPILNSGILKKEKDQFSFSQVCFFNYAFANWLSKTGKTYSQLHAELDFIRFDKVIEYISALKKSDADLLNFLAEQLQVAWHQLVEHDQLEDLNDAETEICNSVAHDVIDILPTPSRESYEGPYQSEEDYEQYMDEAEPLNDAPTTTIKETIRIIDPAIYYHQILSLYARTYRAAEHLLKVSVITHHFDNIVHSYLKSISYNVRIFDQKLRPQLIPILKTALNYEELSVKNKAIAEQQIHAFINFAIAIIPNWAVTLMSSDFFNQRQVLKIRQHREAAEINLVKILLTYCLCELDGIDIVKEIKSLKYERVHESSSLLVKIIELGQLNFSLSKEEKKELAKFSEKILQDRKSKQLLLNLAAISTKMSGVEDEATH